MRIFGFEIVVNPVLPPDVLVLDNEPRELPRDKLGQIVAACVVEDFENDAYAAAVLGRLEDRIRIGLAVGLIP